MARTGITEVQILANTEIVRSRLLVCCESLFEGRRDEKSSLPSMKQASLPFTKPLAVACGTRPLQWLLCHLPSAFFQSEVKRFDKPLQTLQSLK
ncbi:MULTISPECIES: hypothetical protein [Nostocales]|uniref:Uncharacterized protein n=3 Tax=Nostocales TaxID=1161 RepID=A0A8S9T5D7_9CYAN|nr:hypothetical protein [Tolypothrix bouteillei]KAF3887326.1 hypothetical protein DA73_0400018900 [Tolypothrix bouteillei VB521301]